MATDDLRDKILAVIDQCDRTLTPRQATDAVLAVLAERGETETQLVDKDGRPRLMPTWCAERLDREDPDSAPHRVQERTTLTLTGDWKDVPS